MAVYEYQILKGLELSEARLQYLAPRLQVKTLKAGETFWPKGSALPPLTHVVSGMVGANMPNGGSGSIPVNIYGIGSWFGEAGVISEHASAVEYVCIAPSRLLCIALVDATDAFSHELEFCKFIARLAAGRSQQLTEMLTLIKTGNSDMRVVMGLAMFADALGNSVSDLPGIRFEDELSIPIKQSQLAILLSVSPSFFSACIQHLVAANWLRVDYGSLELLNLKAWLAVARGHRQNGMLLDKPSMPEILSLMQRYALP